jgi:hypothetical protein
MDRQDAKMHKILPAIALCMALQPAWADDTTPGLQTPAPLPPGGLMHATLVVSAPNAGPQRPSDPSAMKAVLKAEDEGPKPDDTKSEPTTGVLLAALALMAGIVLRRWGSGQQ